MGKSKKRAGQRPYPVRSIRAEATMRPYPLRSSRAEATAADSVVDEAAEWQPSPAALARLEQLRAAPVVGEDGLTDADRAWLQEQMTTAGQGPNRAQRRAGQPEQIDVTVTWRGRDWRVHVDKANLSVDLLEWFEEGKTTLALRELLGQQQWIQFKAMQPGHVGLNEMFELLAQELGFTSAGES
ncbi:hypothetical protein M3G91_16950 [Micromonospora chalcea]|uniref:hypothetical protein n=1 Tax=Micromonospora chalcea TaxID=1874 RepID=UPI0021A63BD5|nr:hypothetical protein [Micromonospora chalcea]MCT2279306.1 hypothetical protein [Micromonospora chalcea]